MFAQFDYETFEALPRKSSLFDSFDPAEHYTSSGLSNMKLEFKMEGLSKEEDELISNNFISTNPAGFNYTSEPILLFDEMAKVGQNSMEEEDLNNTRSNTTCRMEEEIKSLDGRGCFYSGCSGLEEESESQQSNRVLAPESSAVQDSKELTKKHLEMIYQHTRLPDLQEIADEKTRNCIQMILPILFQNYDPQNPTKQDKIAGCDRKIKLMIFMRKDQYVKKAWSKLKSSLYNKYKKPKTLKTTAHDMLKEELALNHEQVFENLFGSGTCDGLKVESIEHILANKSMFNKIFDHQFFRELRAELDSQTLKDIEVNFLKKLESYLDINGGEKEKSETTSRFRSDRSVKTPFTFLENNTSLIILVDQFIKQLKKTSAIPESEKVSQKNKLESLRKELTDYARTKGWVLEGCKFKKSEIVSFLF